MVEEDEVDDWTEEEEAVITVVMVLGWITVVVPDIVSVVPGRVKI